MLACRPQALSGFNAGQNALVTRAVRHAERMYAAETIAVTPLLHGTIGPIDVHLAAGCASTNWSTERGGEGLAKGPCQGKP